ncbi:hypothetical protein KPL76_03590 [Subtercola sp. PAMC28395]|nr:hypothetical protein [Subtercola sp. PAMC28395]QWT24492.1 hypothetical protein KPL76_03590 [Subtercola sp. PAMC28395]
MVATRTDPNSEEIAVVIGWSDPGNVLFTGTTSFQVEFEPTSANHDQ